MSDGETAVGDGLDWGLCCWPDTTDFHPPRSENQCKLYQELVLEPVVKCLSQTMFSGQPFVFQQDGTPAHTANTTQDWLKHNIPTFIHKDEWPPYSPDLNPMDYSVWSILENKVCSVSHNTASSLKISLCREWEKIPEETLHAAVEGFPNRLRVVTSKKGGYIE
ncbi:hypothetical protein LOD99_1629 [Oopsacas minuta]|uniref:Tc1-like transposase DDE domain-containing protein n=1 Tax=Oopsacas minuta TaxID=111878 RepID=A0AAV7K505_9METZ|nr:hypothetical protein LOD99_1629 [Oopsacas minuta]